MAKNSVSNRSAEREWNSEAYHRLSSPQVSWGKKVLSRLKPGDERTIRESWKRAPLSNAGQRFCERRQAQSEVARAFAMIA